MSPVLLYNLVISLIATFQYFTQAYTLTNGRGDPNNATLFINLNLFREAFVYNQMGYGVGDRLAPVRHRAGPDARRCSRSPASACTTRAASDDAPRRPSRLPLVRRPRARSRRA